MMSNSIHAQTAAQPLTVPRYYRGDGDARMAGTVPRSGPQPSFADTLIAHAHKPVSQSTPYQPHKAVSAMSAQNGGENLPPTATVSEDAFSFGDLLDMLNPLHHIPVVNMAYRAISGDEIRGISKIVGGALFAGPFGVAAGVADVALESGTGGDVVDHAFSTFGSRAKPTSKAMSDTTIAVANLGLASRFVTHRLND